MQKQWIITPRTEIKLLDQILVNRNIEDRERFLHSDYTKLYDPFLLKDMDRTVVRIQQAIQAKEKIAIFGDYDHDGTPAAALLADGIRRCGGAIERVYIPTREEGYSLSRAVIDQFASEGIQLLLTVDCGITNKPEIDYALERGIASIVIDHHVVQDDKFPDMAIVVNPKQVGDTYPFKELCGCGLAFKVVQALGQETKKIAAAEMKWFLDLVAISTICDMVPLTDENRIFVHYGLIVLRKTKRLGLQALYQAAAIDPETISTYTVGFGIGPRLNAPGRMARASIAYELLVTEDESSAKELAAKLEQLNKERQTELETVLKAAEQSVQEQSLHKKKVILVAGDGWADGVVGLVAGRLMDRYSRPTIVLSKREDGLAKGSARSLASFHLVEALQLCEKRLTKFGGHARAAGLTLPQDQLELFYDELIEIAEKQLQPEDLMPKVTVDAVLKTEEVTLQTAEQLASLEPHGFGNPKPIVMIEKATVISAREIGSTGKHLKLMLRLENGDPLDAIAFGMASRQNECPVDSTIDLVGTLDVNEWKGRKSVQLKVVDLRTI
jgi:single-stranded-DNA-specific exonuclease